MDETPNKLLFPFASSIRRALRKSKTEHYDNNGTTTCASKADVLLKNYDIDRGDKGGTEANASPSVVERRSDVMNGDGLNELDEAQSRHVTAKCSV